MTGMLQSNGPRNRRIIVHSLPVSFGRIRELESTWKRYVWSRWNFCCSFHGTRDSNCCGCLCFLDARGLSRKSDEWSWRDVVPTHSSVPVHGPSKEIAVTRGCGFELLECPSYSSDWPPVIISCSETWRNSCVDIGFTVLQCVGRGEGKSLSVFHTFFPSHGTEEVQTLKRKKHLFYHTFFVAICSRNFQLLNIVPSLMKIRQSVIVTTEKSRSHTRTSNIMVTLNGVFSL